MVAIAAVVATKRGSSFVYYTKPVPRWLRKNPVGNFARAMALGAEVGFVFAAKNCRNVAYHIDLL